MVILPLVAWALMFLVVYGLDRPALEALLAGFGVCTAFVLVSTALLSLADAVTLPWVSAAWLALIALVAVAGRRAVTAGVRRLRERRAGRLDAGDRVVAIVIGTFLAASAAGALLYPATNYDSLTYHMPRVFFWFQNHSAALFPTPEGRQLFSAPLVEYWALHLKVLSFGGERAVNFVQWCSYALTIALAGMIAGQLGASRRGRQVAAIAAAAVPMAALQASTTQNDLTCALWSLAAVYGMTAYLAERPTGRATFGYAARIGAALALAVAAKPTGYLIAAPFVVWFAIAVGRRGGARRLGALAGVALLVFATLGAGWYAQTGSALQGDILGLSAPGNTHILVKDRTPGALAVNAVKNSSMQLGTPSPAVNSAISGAVGTVLAALGGDVENPLTKEGDAGPYQLDARVINHDIAPAPLVVLLIGAALVTWATSSRGTRAHLGSYMAAAGTSWLLMAALISWNHYVNRVTLPALLLWLPVVGVAAGAAIEHRRRVATAILGLLLAGSLAWGLGAVLFSSTNRLVPASALGLTIGARDIGWWNLTYDELRFRIAAPEYEDAFKAVAEAVHADGAARVGLDARSGDFRVQPLLWLLRDVRVDYVGETVLADRLPVTADPEVIVLVVPRAGFREGELAGKDFLLPPQDAADLVIAAYRER